MSFIGIISDNKTFENVKLNLLKNIKNKKLNIININLKSIENIKNIKFEIIIIEANIEKFNNYMNTIKILCENAKYIIVNTDLNVDTSLLQNYNKNIITYGLNHKAIVTISSVTETDILICLQKNIKDIDQNIIEVQEKRLNKKENCNLKIYEILIIYIITLIYKEEIKEEI